MLLVHVEQEKLLENHLGAQSTFKPAVLAVDGGHKEGWGGLAFIRYFYCQHWMLYGIHKGGRRRGLILPNSRAIVLQQCEQRR